MLQYVVGAERIVAFPTHTWGTVNARPPVFHVSLTPSIVGKISEAFRHWAEVIRCVHPTHSVTALGRSANAFIKCHERWNAPCAMDSPYARLAPWWGMGAVVHRGDAKVRLLHAPSLWVTLRRLLRRYPDLVSANRKPAAFQALLPAGR